MQVTTGAVDGLLIFRPQPLRDDRGFFVRAYDEQAYRDAGLVVEGFAQENHSRSSRGAVRGLHVRRDGTEAKLVRCGYGALFDVVVDLRPWSPTFKAVHTERLDDENFTQVFVPAGCAHGVQAISDIADLHYKVTSPYNGPDEAALRWNDPALGIAWPVADAIVSDKDAAAPTLAELEPTIATWFDALRPA